MIDQDEQSLQRLYFVQAIDLFQDAYAPYVLDAMRIHFGERLSAHLRSLIKRNKSPIFVDFVDGQPQPDFLALIHLMTRDGGLRDNQSTYVPLLFVSQRTHPTPNLPVLVPSFKELRLIRLRRNALNHQKTLTGAMIIDSIERILHMVNMLPEAYQSPERQMRLQLLLARAQSSEFEYQLKRIWAAQKDYAHAQQHNALLQEHQTKLDTYTEQVKQLTQRIDDQQREVRQAHARADELHTKLQQLLHDQQMLVSGTAEAVVDVRRQFEPQMAHLVKELSILQSRQSPDMQNVHTIERLQRELAAQQQITADMRIELNRMHERVDTLRSAPLSPKPRMPWRWVMVFCLLGLIGWLWYSGWLMWGIWQIQPLISTMWP